MPVLIATAAQSWTDVSGGQLAVWMGCLYAALLIYNETQKARGKHAVPQPLVTTAQVEYATKQELESVKGQLERMQDQWTREFAELEDKIDENYRQAIRAGESRATKIHDRINAIGENMPGKIIDLLKSTGALKNQ